MQALAETKLLQMTKLSSAVLSVFIDSASDLPKVDDECKPDPFVILTVGNVDHRTSAKKETDAPVWEQGFVFLVANPEHETLLIRIAGKNPDEKNGDKLGEFTFKISELLTQNNLQMVMQSYQLKKSGPTSKIIMSLALKILKRAENGSEKLLNLYDTLIGRPDDKELQGENIESEVSNALKKDMKEQEKSKHPDHEDVGSHTDLKDGSGNGDFSMGCYGLGSIKVTINYSVELHYLSITIHKIM